MNKYILFMVVAGILLIFNIGNVSAWYDVSCLQRWHIGTNITDTNILVSIYNFSSPLRTYNYTEMYIYNCSGTYKIANDTSLLNYYNSQTYAGNNQYSLFNNGVVLFYGFDEATGTYVNDSTQYYATQYGTLTGTWNTTGCKFSSCFQGNGASNKIVLQNLSKYFIGAINYSVETWLQTYSIGSYQDIFICTETGDADNMIRMAIDNNGNISWVSYSGGYNVIIGSYTPYGNGLVHIVGTKYANGSAMLYVNGQLVGNGILSNVLTGRMKLCSIGYKQAANANWFNGIIDELYIYNRTLNITEIYDRYIAKTYNEGIETNGCPTVFNAKDLSTDYLLTFGLLCSSMNYEKYQNSPFTDTLVNGIYNCRFNSSFYYDKNTSFNCSNAPLEINISLERAIGLSAQEHNMLKTTYLLQSVQGADLFPTNNTCIDDNTLKHEYITEVCLNDDCSNLTIKQSNVYCPYGCITESNAYNASCKEPDWLMWVALIIIISVVAFVAFYLGGK